MHAYVSCLHRPIYCFFFSVLARNCSTIVVVALSGRETVFPQVAETEGAEVVEEERRRE